MSFSEFYIDLYEFVNWIPFPCILHEVSGLILSINDLAAEFLNLSIQNGSKYNVFDYFVDDEYRSLISNNFSQASVSIPEFTTLLRLPDQTECTIHDILTIQSINNKTVVCNMFADKEHHLTTPDQTVTSSPGTASRSTEIIDILNMYTFSIKHTIMYMKETTNGRLTELYNKIKNSSNGNVPSQEILDKIDEIRNKVDAFKIVNQPILHKLSKNEISIARAIKEGKTSKEIAQTMNLGLDSINKYRISIRKKLGLSGKSENLSQFLRNLVID